MYKPFLLLKKILREINYFINGGVFYARSLGVKVGDNCRIYTKKFGSEPFLISIGNSVTITEGVSFVTHDGSGWLFRDENGRRFSYSKINIGNNVFIGINSIIMPGVKIDDDVIVAAGSVLTKSVKKGSIVGGVPAKKIGNYCDLKNKALEIWITESGMDSSLNYKSRIISVCNKEFKSYL